MKRIIIGFLFLFHLFGSCQNNKNSDELTKKRLSIIKEGILATISKSHPLKYTKDNIIEIKIPEKTEKTCSFVRVAKYIPLETTNEFLIGSIDRLDTCNNKIFILDKQSNSVHIFSLDGKFKKTINEVGRGPKEYLKLSAMYISRENNYLLVYCNQLKKVLYYDLEGNSLGVKFVYLWFKDFSMFPNGEFCYYVDKAYKNSEMLLITDKQKLLPKTKGISANKNANEYLNYFSECSFFKDYNSTKLIMPAFKDTLFQFTADSVYAKYSINYSKYKLPSEYLEYNTDDFLSNLEKNGNEKYYSLGDFFENDEFVGFELNNGKTWKDLIYCKKTNNIFFGRIIDRNSGMPLYSPVKPLKNELISYQFPDKILQYYEDNKDKNLPKEFINVSKKLKKYDNPIILFLDFEVF